MDADDLAQLISMGGELPADQHVVSHSGGSPNQEVGQIGCFAHADSLAELQLLQEAGAAIPKKHKQRSWELLAQARTEKKALVMKRKAESDAERALAASLKLQAVAAEFPALRHAIGVQVPGRCAMCHCDLCHYLLRP